MNIVERELANEVLNNPQNEREEAVQLLVKENFDFKSELECLLDLCFDFDDHPKRYIDNERGKIVHTEEDAFTDLMTCRGILRKHMPTFKKFEETDDICLELAGLESDDCCLTDSAITMALEIMARFAYLQNLVF